MFFHCSTGLPPVVHQEPEGGAVLWGGREEAGRSEPSGGGQTHQGTAGSDRAAGGTETGEGEDRPQTTQG